MFGSSCPASSSGPAVDHTGPPGSRLVMALPRGVSPFSTPCPNSDAAFYPFVFAHVTPAIRAIPNTDVAANIGIQFLMPPKISAQSSAEALRS